MLFEKMAIAMAVMFLCTFIHALFMIAGDKLVSRRMDRLKTPGHLFARATLLWLVIMWMFIGICVESSVWALVYLFTPELTVLSDAQSAFYFSLVTYTTLGYGDIVLTGDFRVLSAIQAANGVIIFGWTTALIIYYIQEIFRSVQGKADTQHV
jgi:hypothetical protein